MKHRVISLVCVFVLLISFSVHAINFNADETYNSIVVVYTDTGVGSGFYIKDNIIITNAHVVEGNRTVTINFYDDNTTKGTVIKTDVNKDLALIAVEQSQPVLNINTDRLSVGQEVYAIGAPRDMPYTMTKGIISALERRIGDNTYVQIDASVNSGNSGGPLVDDNGDVIGVITLKATDAEGIGFAINTADIMEFIRGVEYADIQGKPDEESPDGLVIPDGEYSKREKILEKENDRLKIVTCISVVLNILLGLVCMYLLFKNNKRKAETDEFDFEIEIEE